jgi:3'(2'), 5'-bisphosphate nucleotidase
LRAAGDATAQRLISTRLALARPGDATLSEEAADDHCRLGADRVWIVDPLDGTREFAEEGRSDSAVHVALWSNGELVAGAVALPGRGVTLSTVTLHSQTLAAENGREPSQISRRIPRLAVSRTRPPAIAERVAAALGAELVPMGSAGAKVAAVVLGDVDGYLHAGGQYEWDSAAPVAVALAAGLHATRLDGSPLRYNQPDPLLPDLLVCVPELAPAILDVTGPVSAHDTIPAGGNP